MGFCLLLNTDNKSLPYVYESKEDLSQREFFKTSDDINFLERKNINCSVIN